MDIDPRWGCLTDYITFQYNLLSPLRFMVSARDYFYVSVGHSAMRQICFYWLLHNFPPS